MIREERLLKVLRAPHVSEKASMAMERTTPSFSKLLLMQPKQKSKPQLRNCSKLKLTPFAPWLLKGK